MDEKLTPLTPVVTPIEERLYVVSPHPVAAAPLSVETTSTAEPIVADESVADLIRMAVAGLRSELSAELQAEVQQELSKGAELNAKN
ncbi:MAG: hypothetical protein LBQ48_02810 [Oscillospiraceae bacterium]|jgi:hypothetical protein|nr:hypothetical protein [Oscillospiraceae bacterium]